MLTITDVTNWGELDITALEQWIGRYAKFLWDGDKRTAIDCIKNALIVEHGSIPTDINLWFYATITLTFHQITNIIKHTNRMDRELFQNIKKLEQNFSPDANALASSFNNCFDYINFEQPREEVLKQAAAVVGA